MGGEGDCPNAPNGLLTGEGTKALHYVHVQLSCVVSTGALIWADYVGCKWSLMWCPCGAHSCGVVLLSLMD